MRSLHDLSVTDDAGDDDNDDDDDDIDDEDDDDDDDDDDESNTLSLSQLSVLKSEANPPLCSSKVLHTAI